MNEFEVIVSLSLMIFVWGGFLFMILFNPFGLRKRIENGMLGYDRDEYWKNVREHDIVYAERMLGSKSIISPKLLDKAELEKNVESVLS